MYRTIIHVKRRKQRLYRLLTEYDVQYTLLKETEKSLSIIIDHSDKVYKPVKDVIRECGSKTLTYWATVKIIPVQTDLS